MGHERIKLTDNTMDIVTKLSDGNPGAMGVIMQLLTEAPTIDPDNFMGGIGTALLLDTYGIYGSDIYVLHNDICERNLAKTIGVLRATQLGMFSAVTLKAACSKQDRSGKQVIPVEDLYSQVKKRLPNFDLQPQI